MFLAERQATMSPPVASERPVGPTAASVHGAVVDTGLNEVGWYENHIWVWINTYENTIFSGMNIHFNPAMTWGEQKGYRVLTHPHFLPAEFFLECWVKSWSSLDIGSSWKFFQTHHCAVIVTFLGSHPTMGQEQPPPSHPSHLPALPPVPLKVQEAAVSWWSYTCSECHYAGP